MPSNLEPGGADFRQKGDSVMYPLPEQKLSIEVIAREWSRFLPGPPSVAEALSCLLKAIWQGELPGRLTPDAPSSDPRSAMLDVLRIHREHPALLVVDSPSEAPPTIVALPDGSALANPRLVIVWPKDPAMREETMLPTASALLEGRMWDDYHPDIRPVFGLLEIDRQDFAAYCARQGYPRPTFWIGDGNPEAECRRWMREKASRHPDAKPDTMPALRKSALETFPGLTQRGFDRVWRDHAPAAWKHPGAPRKP
ncbi:MAG: hypothetical protein AB7F35_25705 [Acetobacteraceae bacterium]